MNTISKGLVSALITGIGLGTVLLASPTFADSPVSEKDWYQGVNTAAQGLRTGEQGLAQQVATEKAAESSGGISSQKDIIRGVPEENGALFRPDLDKQPYSIEIAANAIDTPGASPLGHPIAWLRAERAAVESNITSQKFGLPQLQIEWDAKVVTLGDIVVGWLVPARAIPGTYDVELYGYKAEYELVPQSDEGDSPAYGPEQYGQVYLRKTQNQIGAKDPVITCDWKSDENLRLVIAGGNVVFVAFDNFDHSHVGDFDRARPLGQLKYVVGSHVLHVDASLLSGQKTGHVIDMDMTSGQRDGDKEYSCR